MCEASSAPSDDERVKVRLKFQVHDIVRQAIENGLAYAAMRAFKHRDDDSMDERDLDQYLQDYGVDHVMNALYEVINFADSEVLDDDLD